MEETNAYPINDPNVKALAQKAIGDAKTDEDKAKRLCKFIYKYISSSRVASAPRKVLRFQRSRKLILFSLSSRRLLPLRCN